MSKRARNEDEWEDEEAAVERPVSAVVSVRFPSDVAQRVFAEAEARGVPTSVLIRTAVEEYLDSSVPAGASYDWTFSSNDVAVVFYAGRSSQGRTAGSAHPIEDVLVTN
jgi:hypothetical protein